MHFTGLFLEGAIISIPHLQDKYKKKKSLNKNWAGKVLTAGKLLQLETLMSLISVINSIKKCAKGCYKNIFLQALL